jgi:hypothetical protein
MEPGMERLEFAKYLLDERHFSLPSDAGVKRLLDHTLLLPLYMRSFSTRRIDRSDFVRSVEEKKEGEERLQRFYDTVYRNRSRFRHIRELEVKLNVSEAVSFIRHCPNVRKLVLAGETDLFDLIRAPFLSKLEVLNVELKYDKDHEEIQLGFARRQLRMPNLVRLFLRSRLMPRFLNAMVENAPNLEELTLNIHTLQEEDTPQLVSDRLVSLVTEFIIESGDGSVPALCLADFAIRKDDDGEPLFQPHHIDVDWWSTGSSADESNIWPALLQFYDAARTQP